MVDYPTQNVKKNNPNDPKEFIGEATFNTHHTNPFERTLISNNSEEGSVEERIRASVPNYGNQHPYYDRNANHNDPDITKTEIPFQMPVPTNIAEGGHAPTPSPSPPQYSPSHNSPNIDPRRSSGGGYGGGANNPFQVPSGQAGMRYPGGMTNIPPTQSACIPLHPSQTPLMHAGSSPVQIPSSGSPGQHSAVGRLIRPIKLKQEVKCADTSNINFTIIAPIHSLMNRIHEIKDEEKIKFFYNFPGVRFFPLKQLEETEQIFGGQGESTNKTPYTYFLCGYAIFELLILKESALFLEIIENRLQNKLRDKEGIFNAINNNYFNDECIGHILEIIQEIKCIPTNPMRMKMLQDLLLNSEHYKVAIIVMIKSVIAEMKERNGESDQIQKFIKEDCISLNDFHLQDLADAFHIKINTHYKDPKENKFSILSKEPKNSARILRHDINLLIYSNNDKTSDYILYPPELTEMFPEGWRKEVTNLISYKYLPQNLQIYLTDSSQNLVNLILRYEENSEMMKKQKLIENQKLEQDLRMSENKVDKLITSSGIYCEAIDQFLTIFDKYVESKILSKIDLQDALNNLNFSLNYWTENISKNQVDDILEEKIARLNQKSKRMSENSFLDEVSNRTKNSKEYSGANSQDRNMNHLEHMPLNFQGGGIPVPMQPGITDNMNQVPQLRPFMPPPEPLLPTKISCNTCYRDNKKTLPRLQNCQPTCQLSPICSSCLFKIFSKERHSHCPKCLTPITEKDLNMIYSIEEGTPPPPILHSKPQTPNPHQPGVQDKIHGPDQFPAMQNPNQAPPILGVAPPLFNPGLPQYTHPPTPNFNSPGFPSNIYQEAPPIIPQHKQPGWPTNTNTGIIPRPIGEGIQVPMVTPSMHAPPVMRIGDPGGEMPGYPVPPPPINPGKYEKLCVFHKGLYAIDYTRCFECNCYACLSCLKKYIIDSNVKKHHVHQLVCPDHPQTAISIETLLEIDKENAVKINLRGYQATLNI